MSSDDADSLARQVCTRPDGRRDMRLPRIITDYRLSHKIRSISAGEVYLTKSVEWAADHFLFDINQSTFDEDVRENRFFIIIHTTHICTPSLSLIHI